MILYPAPDRSDFIPNQGVHDGDVPQGDLGFSTGTLSDGRPYRVESWFSEGYSFITVFFSLLHLEDAKPSQLTELIAPVLEEARVPNERRQISDKDVRRITDASKNEMYSLTFVVGEPDF